jgi:hypothetical protein
MQEQAESCGNSCGTKKNDCKDDCNENNCPFGICCNNCLFFNIEHKELMFILPLTIREGILPADEPCCSDYTSDCWHPPEIV